MDIRSLVGVGCIVVLLSSAPLGLGGCSSSSSPSAGSSQPASAATPQATPVPQTPATPQPLPPPMSGGGCGSGPCTIASGQQGVTALAVSGSNLYFGTAGGQVNVLDLGTGNITQLYSESGQIRRIRVDSGGVYWISTADVLRMYPFAQTGIKTIYAATNTPGDFAIDANNAYVSTGVQGTVVEVTKDGSAKKNLVSGQTDCLAVETDGTAVYWSNGGDGTLHATAIGTGTDKVIATTQGLVPQLAIDPLAQAVSGGSANTLYWVDTYGSGPTRPGVYGMQVFCADAACSSVYGSTINALVAASQPQGPWAIVALGGVIDWTNLVTGFVGAVPASGGGATVLDGITAPFAIASDSSNVYVGTNPTGSQQGVIVSVPR